MNVIVSECMDMGMWCLKWVIVFGRKMRMSVCVCVCVSVFKKK